MSDEHSTGVLQLIDLEQEPIHADMVPETPGDHGDSTWNPWKMHFYDVPGHVARKRILRVQYPKHKGLCRVAHFFFQIFFTILLKQPLGPVLQITPGVVTELERAGLRSR
jgi:hypothetical protein